MWRKVPAAAAIGCVGAAGLCEALERAADAKRGDFARLRLLELRDEAARASAAEQEPRTAWLNSEAPQFPYLLAISTGDDPHGVTDGVLNGALVVGSSRTSAGEMVNELCAAPTRGGQLVQATAQWWKDLKGKLHGSSLPGAFDPRVSSADLSRDAVVDALMRLKAADVTSTDTNRDASTDGDANPPPSHFVFLLAGLDSMTNADAERWLKWTHEITSNGLAHVVAPIQRAVTPARIEWLQARHHANYREGDFVAILLRVAKGAVDRTTAEQKVAKAAEVLGFELFESTESTDDRVAESKPRHDQEIDIIAKAAGNWWGDVFELCNRLVEAGLPLLTDEQERLATIHLVCEEYLRDTSQRLVNESLALSTDLGVLENLRAAVNEDASFFDPSATNTALENALSTLESWRCLEGIAGLSSAGGGPRATVGSVQELVGRKDMPENCVHPVDALLHFNHRPEGERKFLGLIDENVLLLRPKTDIEIGVVPCETKVLVSPCWVEVRPIIKRAFEKLWRNDEYFAAIQALERLSTSLHLCEEIKLFEAEIAEREQTFKEMQRDLTIRQQVLTPAERSQRKAEIALIEVELEAKRVYLEKLRALLT